MPTDVPAFRAKLLQERQIVADEVALIDLEDEEAKIDAARTALATAQATYDRRARRWTLVQEKIHRLEILDAQIDLFSP